MNGNQPTHFLTLVLALAAPVIIMLAATVTAAGDIDAGKRMAEKCAFCHGSSGITNKTDVPNLAGQNPGYFIRQMQNFRNGERRGEPMQEIARGISDQSIEDLAAYYHSLGNP